MCKDFLPLIDQHSRKMREDLLALERGLDVVITTQKDQFSEVFQFVQEAVLLWNDQKSVIDELHKRYEVIKVFAWLTLRRVLAWYKWGGGGGGGGEKGG
jgi:hypothetical protein